MLHREKGAKIFMKKKRNKGFKEAWYIQPGWKPGDTFPAAKTVAMDKLGGLL